MNIKKLIGGSFAAMILTAIMITAVGFFAPKILGIEEDTTYSDMEDSSDIGNNSDVGDGGNIVENPEEKAYLEAVSIYEQGKYFEAMAKFEALGNYKDSEIYYSNCQSAVEAEKEAQKKAEEYNRALSLIAQEKYDEALTILTELGNYEDCVAKIGEVSKALEAKATALANIGNYAQACEVLDSLGYDKQNSELYQAYVYASEGDFANAVKSGLTVVVFPEGTEVIPDNYFKDSSHSYNLQKIVLPTSLKTIGNSAFYGCVKLSEIQLPNGLISIGESTFEGCVNLTEIDLPEGLLTIGKSAFKSSGLRRIGFPNTLQTIGEEAFAGCHSITSIMLPNSLVDLGKSAFSGCSHLSAVTIPGSVKIISQYTFSNCEKLVTVSILDGADLIDSYAFSGCSMLTTVTLPSTLQKIEDNVFYQCTTLSEITIPANVNWIGRNVFAGCKALKNVYFDSADGWTDGVRLLDVGDSQSNASKLKSLVNTIWTKKTT